MNSDTIILIQGASSNVREQKYMWKSHKVLFSTWKGSEHNYDSSDCVIFNDPPLDPGPINFWFQQVSTINGLKKAQEMGYKHCLKIRSDMIPTNPTALVDSLDKEKLNFLCWDGHEVYPKCDGYLIDFLMSGPIETMIELWNINTAFCVVPEIMLTWNYIKNCKCFPKTYFLDKLDENNDLYWIKRNIFLSSYKKDSRFSNKDSYLTESYLHFFESTNTQ
jgi:hypothetical protein